MALHPCSTTVWTDHRRPCLRAAYPVLSWHGWAGLGLFCHFDYPRGDSRKQRECASGLAWIRLSMNGKIQRDCWNFGLHFSFASPSFLTGLLIDNWVSLFFPMVFAQNHRRNHSRERRTLDFRLFFLFFFFPQLQYGVIQSSSRLVSEVAAIGIYFPLLATNFPTGLSRIPELDRTAPLDP